MAEKFSAEERAAMRERNKELKETKNREESAAIVVETLAAMPEADRAIGERLHEIILAVSPDLYPKNWYGQPAYYKDGAVICFFQGSAKFKTRYSTLGFSDSAAIDEGSMWPTSFGLTSLTKADEKRVIELVTRAIS